MSTQTLDPEYIQKRDHQIYRLKISLRYVDPPLWRRLEVPGGIPMSSLAIAIHTAFGWSGDHMCEFKVKKLTIGDGSDWFVEDRQQERDELRSAYTRLGELVAGGQSLDLALATVKSENDAKHDEDYALDDPTLWEMVPRSRTKFSFLYDFGDCWEHDIQVEKIGAAESGALYPRCTGGARAHPIEDSGGYYSFMEMVEAIGHPEHESYWQLEEWGLEKWDPAKFDLDGVNRTLEKIFKLKRRKQKQKPKADKQTHD